MPEQTHRHAAIMFTDIVGYTALMGSDEDKAFEVLKKNQEIHNDLIKQFNGTLIKEMGDGMLISFHLASEAVRCGIAIQKVCKEQDIPLKIGIHEGEMVFAESDVLGDSVNIASRLQEDAEKGCIHISSSVYKNVRNKADINTRFVEERTFKNVAEPVKVYQVLGDGEEQTPVAKNPKSNSKKYVYFIVAGIAIAAILLWIFLPVSTNPDSIDIEKSIAVIPFVDMSPEKDQEYLSDGIAENIITSLSGIEELRVIGRTSSFQFKGEKIDLRDVGEKLQVATVLEGSIQKSGNTIRITAQLINVKDGSHIWSEQYDREMTDIFAIQDDIALGITERLRITLLIDSDKTSDKIPTKNMEAYEYYLKGRHIQADWSINNVQASFKYFERAIALDSLFDEAYVWMGVGYIALGSWYGNLSGKEASELANPYFYKALEINPENAQALNSLGRSRYYFNWDFEGADSLYQLAYKISGGDKDCHCLMLGDYDQVINRDEKALENDPFAVRHWQLAYAYLFKGDAAKTITVMQEGLDLHPNQESYYDHFADIYIELGDYDRAIQLIDKGLDISDKRHPSMLINKAIALYKKNQVEEAEKYVKEVIDHANKGENEINYFISHYYSQTGDFDEAFKWLEIAYERHEVDMIWLKRQLSLAPIRSDPRYFDLVRRVGFPE
jgi:TolB-like protein/class 3 adenylate cyclase/Tfp pilus assembly protein PilF